MILQLDDTISKSKREKILKTFESLAVIIQGYDCQITGVIDITPHNGTKTLVNFGKIGSVKT
jgi:hypothetical protein